MGGNDLVETFFKDNPKVAIACSGGVDSLYLAYLANKYAKSCIAYFVKTCFQPQFELEDAKAGCKEIGIQLCVIELNPLSNKEIVSNPENRCYFCKKDIFTGIMQKAKEDGFLTILEGTNGSDDLRDRPGVRALEELKICSPLLQWGYTKEQIRMEAKAANIFVYNKPSYACLATRIPKGETITKELLNKIEAAEDIMFALEFKDFRVRVNGDTAKIQVTEEQLTMVMEKRVEIVKQLQPFFHEIVLDMIPRRSQ